jgi:hypothetical protein
VPVDEAAASGAAHNASIKVQNNVGALEAALAEARAAEKAAAPHLVVARLEEKLAKFKANIAEVEAELAAARALAKEN